MTGGREAYGSDLLGLLLLLLEKDSKNRARIALRMHLYYSMLQPGREVHNAHVL